MAMVTTPVAESIVAPCPLTANVSASPAKAAAAATATGARAGIGGDVGEGRHHRRRLGGRRRAPAVIRHGAARGVGRRHPRGEGLAVVGGPRRVGKAGRAATAMPSSSQATAISGAGTPSQAPGSRVTRLPTVAVPGQRRRRATSAGATSIATAATVRRKRLVARRRRRPSRSR